jgi:hypothetical protein
MKNQPALLIATALLGVVAIVGLRWAKSPSEVRAANPPAALQNPVRAVSAGTGYQNNETAIVAPTKVEAPLGMSDSMDLAVPIMERPGYSKESSDLILAMVRHPELNLSQTEMEKMLTVYLDATNKRTTYEASIAKVESVSATERRLVIPPYPLEGRKIEDELYKNFATILGDGRAASVENALRSELYFRNYGYGQSEQTITVRLEEISPPDVHYEITHSVAAIHSVTKDPSGGVRDVNLAVKGARSVLPLRDLGSYNAMLQFFPAGTKS